MREDVIGRANVDASRSDDACPFAFNDLSVIEALGLYREEAFGDNEAISWRVTDKVSPVARFAAVSLTKRLDGITCVW